MTFEAYIATQHLYKDQIIARVNESGIITTDLIEELELAYCAGYDSGYQTGVEEVMSK